MTLNYFLINRLGVKCKGPRETARLKKINHARIKFGRQSRIRCTNIPQGRPLRA